MLRSRLEAAPIMGGSFSVSERLTPVSEAPSRDGCAGDEVACFDLAALAFNGEPDKGNVAGEPDVAVQFAPEHVAVREVHLIGHAVQIAGFGAVV